MRRRNCRQRHRGIKKYGACAKFQSVLFCWNFGFMWEIAGDEINTL